MERISSITIQMKDADDFKIDISDSLEEYKIGKLL